MNEDVLRGETALFSGEGPRFSFLKGLDGMKQIEGQVRIPSGCAIAAVISKDGTECPVK